jgi:hypothetical protein
MRRNGRVPVIGVIAINSVIWMNHRPEVVTNLT